MTPSTPAKASTSLEMNNELTDFYSQKISRPTHNSFILDFNLENPMEYMMEGFPFSLFSPGAWRRAFQSAQKSREYHDTTMGKEEAKAFRKEYTRNNSWL